MMQISVLVLLAATVFSTGVTFADTGNTSSGTFQERVQDRLNTAVADGKITEEQAAEKLTKFEDWVVSGGKFKNGGKGHKAGFIGRDALQDRLNTAVADGKITAEEAAEKLAKFEEIVDSGGKFRGPKFGHGVGNGQSHNANNAVYQGV